MNDDEKLRLLHRIDGLLFTDNGPNPDESGKDIQQSRIEGLIAENDRLREALKQIDDHMVLVPRAPTNDMLDAGLEEDTWSPLEIYRAMIAASQEPKL